MTDRWCASPFAYTRRPTREVAVGDVVIGGRNPIRIQSMTTPATTDTEATVGQIVRLMEAGCEIVRVTVPTSADARNLPAIRAELVRRGLKVPLVADIHFSPGAALKAVEYVEKIRVNPGNYADRKQFAVREYTDAQYDSELARIADTFRPLVTRAKELGVAMRIGTNHGSLSDRIVNRYGDSPLGMVESALEFVRICETEGYRALVISMKSSNPVVTIEAYRLLAARMAAEGMDYPFHLGVTEAGDGADGRIKSAIGIGSLLDDGLGDTIRVSLTEDPVSEIPVAIALAEPYNRRLRQPGRADDHPHPAGAGSQGPPDDPPLSYDPFSYARRRSHVTRFGPCLVGGEQTVRVEVPLFAALVQTSAIRAEIDAQAGPRVPAETRADLVEATLTSVEDLPRLAQLRQTLRLVAPAVAISARGSEAFLEASLKCSADSRASADRLRVAARPLLDFVQAHGGSLGELARSFGCPLLVEGMAAELLELLSAVADGPSRIASGASATPLEIALTIPVSGTGDATSPVEPVQDYRRLAAGLSRLGMDIPIVLSFEAAPGASEDQSLLAASRVLGSLLCDGIGDAIAVRVGDAGRSRALGFNILQAARVRVSKTEFISCPSCGRTLFDLEETTRRIKERTAHLKGLKIAIMGCVVNGPGEMADADFGYVGWGTDKIALFVGKEMVERDIPVAEADDRLVALIKRHGKWQDLVLSEEPVP